MPIKIFFCYAHEDEALLNKLKLHLRPLQREGLIDVWYDRDIRAGTEWERQIDQHLNEAHIILLLVSPDFMNSDYCYSFEMQRALERHKRGQARVIPVILRPISWQSELGNLQALPTDAKPITGSSWHSFDEAFFDVVEGIRNVIVELPYVMVKIDTNASYLVWFNESLEQKIGGNDIWPVTIIWSEQEKQFQYPDGGYTITFDGPDKDGGIKGIGKEIDNSKSYSHKLYPVDHYGKWKQLLAQNAPARFIIVSSTRRYHLEVRQTIATLRMPLDMKPIERSNCSYKPNDKLVLSVNNNQVEFNLQQQQADDSYIARGNGGSYFLWPILTK